MVSKPLFLPRRKGRPTACKGINPRFCNPGIVDRLRRFDDAELAVLTEKSFGQILVGQKSCFIKNRRGAISQNVWTCGFR